MQAGHPSGCAFTVFKSIHEKDVVRGTSLGTLFLCGVVGSHAARSSAGRLRQRLDG